MLKHIVCFGDSNTHGYRAEDMGRFDEETRWTARLCRLLGPEYLVIEEGLSGRTTSFEDPVREGMCGLNYIVPCLQSHAPVSLLIVMLGTNDTKERFASTSACIGMGLKRLIDKARFTEDCWEGGSPNILIVTPKNIDPRYENTPAGLTMGAGCATKSEGLAKEYRRIARMTGCHYLDANEVVSQVNSIDYIHLTSQGHAELAAHLGKLIPTLL